MTGRSYTAADAAEVARLRAELRGLVRELGPVACRRHLAGHVAWVAWRRGWVGSLVVFASLCAVAAAVWPVPGTGWSRAAAGVAGWLVWRSTRVVVAWVRTYRLLEHRVGGDVARLRLLVEALFVFGPLSAAGVGRLVEDLPAELTCAGMGRHLPFCTHRVLL